MTANVEHCNQLLMQSMAIATALCPAIGYEKATAIVKKALKEHRTAVDVALEELSMPKEEIERIVSNCLEAVSYTHLDVYKRQLHDRGRHSRRSCGRL